MFLMPLLVTFIIAYVIVRLGGVRELRRNETSQGR